MPSTDAPMPGRSELTTRLLGSAASERVWGWAIPALIAVIGGFLRFWHLDQPHKLVFDETYYVKEAASYLQVGYELASNGDSTPKPDDLFTHGTTNVFQNTPEFVVHPPAGKWMIAFGEWIFGPASSWGWRFSAAAVGTLSILMLGRIARRLFGSTLLGAVAALLLAVDGQHFVLSRTGLLDIFVMFWALAGFGLLLIDRDRSRVRLAQRVEKSGGPPGTPLQRYGPGLGIRWWRIAAGVCLGLSAASKWSGVFFLAAFGLLTVMWDVSARRTVRSRHWLVTGLFRDGTVAALQMLPVALVTYVATWTGWFLGRGGYDRQWGAQNPSASFGWVPDALRSLWRYHADMYHANITLDSPHIYQSNPWSWLVLGRPTAFFYESYKTGQHGCTVQQCSHAITALGNPVIWWGGTLALAVVLFAWALGRDWRAGAVLSGLVGGYLPWFMFQTRTIYSFYAVAFVPWVVLGLTYTIGLMLGNRDASPERRMYAAVGAGAVVLLAVVAFGFFYPVLAGSIIPQPSWGNRMWLPSWI